MRCSREIIVQKPTHREGLIFHISQQDSNSRSLQQNPDLLILNLDPGLAPQLHFSWLPFLMTWPQYLLISMPDPRKYKLKKNKLFCLNSLMLYRKVDVLPLYNGITLLPEWECHAELTILSKCRPLDKNGCELLHLKLVPCAPLKTSSFGIRRTYIQILTSTFTLSGMGKLFSNSPGLVPHL